MNFLLIDIPNNTELLETTDCCEAIAATIAQVTNDVHAELFVYYNDEWFSWTLDTLDFIGPRPKTPPTRA